MRLLLHTCCAPCAIIPVTRLRALGYDLVAYFANPNIQPVKEYLQRREALAVLAQKINLPVLWQDDVYSLEGWLGYVHSQGIASNAGASRCTWCTGSRLALTYAAAKAHGFEAFSTSLLYSTYQAHETIRGQCENLVTSGQGKDEAKGAEQKKTPFFVYEDFRTGWQEGIDTAKQYELYRQNYCGCIFSETDRYAKALQRCIAQAAS